MEIMEAVFGTKDFVNTSGAGGGDFNTPGSTEYQHLHSDGGGGDKGPDTYPDVKMEYRNDGTRHRLALDAPEDPDYRYQIMNTRDLPVREWFVTANVRPHRTTAHIICYRHSSNALRICVLKAWSCPCPH